MHRIAGAAPTGRRGCASLTLALGFAGRHRPVSAAAAVCVVFGVNLPEAGLLLAANRLVRIAGYGWVARGYERFGPRAACIAASVGAVARDARLRALSGVGRCWPRGSLGPVVRRPQHRDAGPGDRRGRRRGAAQRPVARDHLGRADARPARRRARWPKRSVRDRILVLGAVAMLASRWRSRLPAGPGELGVPCAARLELPSPLDVGLRSGTDARRRLRRRAVGTGAAAIAAKRDAWRRA